MHIFNRRPFAALLLGAALAVAAIHPALAQAQAQTQARGTMTVAGEGRVTVRPDMAWVSLGVVKEARIASDALNGMSAALAAVVAGFEAAGIAPEDMQTSQLSLRPRYSYPNSGGPARLDGFTASSTIEIRVRDLDKLGAVLDAAVGDGANELGGIRFDLNDRSAAMNSAREAAVADARARAALYAGAAGVDLGALLSFSEAGVSAPPMPVMQERMAMDASVPVVSGELEIAASVTMVYALVE